MFTKGVKKFYRDKLQARAQTEINKRMIKHWNITKKKQQRTKKTERESFISIGRQKHKYKLDETRQSKHCKYLISLFESWRMFRWRWRRGEGGEKWRRRKRGEADMRFFNFRPKLLHRQLHLILTILVIKTQNMSENGEIYTAGREKKI